MYDPIILSKVAFCY